MYVSIYTHTRTHSVLLHVNQIVNDMFEGPNCACVSHMSQ